MGTNGSLVQSEISSNFTFPSTIVGTPKFKAALYSPSMEIMLDAVEKIISEPHASFNEFSCLTYLIVMAVDHLADLRGAFTAAGFKTQAESILMFET